MRKIILLLFICSLFSCVEVEKTSDTNIQIESERLLNEAARETGLPNITNFQQKKLMKMIYELCDKSDLICHAYLFSEYSSKLIYLGKCIGFGIPFSAQYSNPEKSFRDPNSYNGTPSLKMPQAEPNGLFMPTSSSATWLMMIDPETNKPEPVYFEPEIIVSPFMINIK